MPLTFDDLRLASLARQFPQSPPQTAPDLLATTGPIQTQTARSTFLGLAARSAGLDKAALTDAFERHRLLRGSTIRGTVHTMTPRQQQVLDALTRAGQRTLWQRTLPLTTMSLDEAWAAVETFAWDDWRTPDELKSHLCDVFDTAGEPAASAGLRSQSGRYFSFGHGGLVRRPLSGGWDAQGRPGYRAAEAITGLPRLDADEAMRAAVRMHLTHHGPATRRDLAWWAGVGLRAVDAAIADQTDLVEQEGPGGQIYLDLPDAPQPRELPGVVLLPEFDALLCGYDSKQRDRFVTPEHHDLLWSQNNGQILPPLLVDGRITGYWRMTGSARRRPVEVRWFSRTRRPRKAELDEPLARVEAALDITVSRLSVALA